MKIIRKFIIISILIFGISSSAFGAKQFLPRQFEMSPTAIEYFSKECNMQVTSGMITFDPENVSAKIEAYGIQDGVQWEISAYWKNGYFMMITFSNPKQIKGNG